MNLLPAKHLTIRTPEGVVFRLRIADPIRRLLALVIDLFLVASMGGVLGMLIQRLSGLAPDWGGAVYMITSFVLSFGYPIVMEWQDRGRTIGKRLLRLQVVDELGLRLTFQQVLVRNLLRFADSFPVFYGVGGLAAFASLRGQRLGDWAANTLVVYHPPEPAPDLDNWLAGKYNSFRSDTALVARLRQAAPQRLQAIAVTALMRRDQLHPDARLKVFAGIRRRIEQNVRIPPVLVEGLSDEQVVRNTVDVLAR
ncbi:MAG: hypothetical protein A2498_04755 [Lentisphaerae bacterium RIFOXYC12_FULL_60_16]|nr:MAG: hypothetical protein A2498_04755 [Lentisphaerae bacterium RIFOXYC12_FULL_60_16]OGV77932.1 MAG: hypothetical protein A2340_10190 [Lentisphaerae bacterium RIFOXYB12_FULL_60_10]